jgi:hypothetical protein
MNVQTKKMDLQTRKISFVQEFLRLQNEDIIIGLETMLKRHKAKLFESNLKPMSLEQLNKEIDESLIDSENDRVVNALDLKSKFERWS